MTQIIYVTSPESQQIYVWLLEEKYKKLHLIQIIFTPGQGQPIAIHPNKQFLYVGIRPNFKIITYSINKLGLLKSIGNTKILNSPTYLAINIQGTFLYCASYQYNSVSVYPIQKSGIISHSIQQIEDLLGCHAIGIDKNNEELIWIPCLKENSIRIFKTNIFGTLTQFHLMCVNKNIINGPRHIVFHKTDYYAYVINELNSTIDVIYYNHTHTLPYVIQTLNIVPTNIMHMIQFWGADIHITPNGNWLYCSDRATNIISYFKIFHENKKLEFINYQYTEEQPRGFAIDFTGQFLIVAGQKSHHISLYDINQDNGELILVSRYYSGKGPIWISVIELD